MSDLYHGPYPVDMTPAEALRELQTARPFTPEDRVTNELRSIYDVLHCIYDTCEDEGDRIYFGSTNDRWTLQRQLRRLEKLLSPTNQRDPA